jgi:hypothetical protein
MSDKKPTGPTPRNPVARAAQTVAKGSGRHTNKMRASKMGQTKHKGKVMDSIDSNLSELQKPAGSAFLKFAKKENVIYAYIGLGNDEKEVKVPDALIAPRMIMNENDLMRLVQEALKDSMYSLDKIIIVVPQPISKSEMIMNAVNTVKTRFEDRIEVKMIVPTEREPVIRRPKNKIKYDITNRPMTTREFDPNKLRVEFTVTDSDFEILLRASGINFQDGKFVVKYDQYQKILDLMKQPEVTQRFGRRDLIKNKKFIESREFE